MIQTESGITIKHWRKETLFETLQITIWTPLMFFLCSLSLYSATLLDNLKVLTELNCVFQQNYWMLDIHTIAQNKWSLVIKCSRPRKLQFFFFVFKREFVILLVHDTCFLLCNFFKQWLEILRGLEQFSTFV